MARLNTSISWFTMAIPDICSVPTCPTMILSKSPTKFVIPFWIIMGTAMPNIIL